MQYRYDLEKNAILIKERGVGFEEIIDAISQNNLIKVVSHHNQERYPGQKIMYVKCLDKVYLVPYVIEENGTIFLKTLYPSRKATKLYLNNQ